METEITNLTMMEGAVDFSFLTLFIKSDLVVKFVIGILVLFSLLSWKIIFQKHISINSLKRISKKFESDFWSGVSLDELYKNVDHYNEESFSTLFKNVMEEYKKTKSTKHLRADSFFIQRLETVVEQTITSEQARINKGMSFLASSGSISPFVGLFGTVWGIMHSFQAIAIAQNTNLAVVAPGIAEALFVTALGLFVAIPATGFYNSLTSRTDEYLSEVENFGKDLLNIISRQIS